MKTTDVLLGEIAQIIDCEHKTAPEELHDVFAFSVGTRALSENFIDFSKCKPVGEETYYAWSRRGEVEPLDIILAREAPVGGVGLVESGQRVCLGQRTVLVRANQQKVSPVFLKYYLQSPKSQGWFREVSTGTTVKHVNVGDIKKMPISGLPDLATQTLVASVLKNLDKKISANQLCSESLEALAREIFKHWFIDFEPVKAKMAGRAPVGMDAETAARLPDSMEESELGEVPAGWLVSSLADVVSVTKGKSYKSSELKDSSVSLVTLKSFLRGGGYREDGLKPYSGTFKDEQVVQPGELVMAFTDVTQAADLIGVPAIVSADPSAERLVASLDVGIVRPHSASVSNLFIYFLLKSERFREHAKAHASGTTVLHLSKDAVPNFEIAVPPDELLTKFREIAEPAFALADSLSQESRMLASLRDGLLPRLISGELQIPAEMLAA